LQLPRGFQKLLEHPGDLVSNIIDKEASKSFQEAPRKVQKISGQKFRINFVGFLEEVLTPKGHFEIN
jgi:hypothetical protein